MDIKIKGGFVTNIGSTRKVNQDAICLFIKEDLRYCFAFGAVCDGVGGLEHGEFASLTVIEEIREWYEKVAGWIDIQNIETEILYAHLLDAVEEWNRNLRDKMYHAGLRTGTTLSAIMIIRDRYYIIQIGDSRIYRYREHLEQLTVDATVSRLKDGKMKEYLSNYMGKDDTLWYTTAEGTVREGDMFLFCSDGGYHLLLEADVEKVYRTCTNRVDLTKRCEELVQTMIQRGERDNISLGLIMADSIKAKRKGFLSGSEMF